MEVNEKLISEFQKALELNEEADLVAKLQDSIVIHCEVSRCPPQG